MDCKECVFAEWYTTSESMILNESNFIVGKKSCLVQTGCECGRVKVFEKRGEASMTVGEPYYRLTKFCNAYRTKEWQEKQDKPVLEALQQEVMPLFGIAVYDHADKTLEDLQRTVDSILATEYQKNKIKVILSTFKDRGINAVANIVNNMQHSDSGIKNSSAAFQVIDHSYVRDSEAFKKLVQATYFVNIKSGSELPPKIFDDIDYSLNEKLERIVMFEGDGFSVISRKVVTDIYLEFGNYDQMVDHIRQHSQEQGVYKKYEEKK